LSISNLPFSYLGYDPLLPRADSASAVKIPV
jgi:hypothetical protein